MTTWKYLKGSEKDFAGAHAGATHKYIHKELGHPVYTANPEIIKEVLFNLVAVREPITAADVEVVKYDPTKVDGDQLVKCGELKIDGEVHNAAINKYIRDCKGVQVDVYDVLQAFDVTNPALQHLIKKALCVGIRGHKTKQQDLQDIIDSAIRAKELESK